MKPLRIAQISDFHLTAMTWNPFYLCSKRILGTLNWLFSRKGNFSKAQVDALPAFLSTLQLDWIFLGGDFTTTSLFSEYKMAKSFVDALPAPWVGVPGNHDHYTQTAYRTKRFYKVFGKKPMAQQLNETWWAITLDTTRANWTHSATGLFSEKLEQKLLQTLSTIPQNHSILLLNHYPFFQHDIPRHRLVRGEVLQKIIRKDQRIKAYLHGHTHQHIIANLQPSGLPLILDSGSCADSKKGTCNLLTIDDHGIGIDVYRWDGKWTKSRKEEVTWNRGSILV